jgi:hypothetical protein
LERRDWGRNWYVRALPIVDKMLDKDPTQRPFLAKLIQELKAGPAKSLSASNEQSPAVLNASQNSTLLNANDKHVEEVIFHAFHSSSASDDSCVSMSQSLKQLSDSKRGAKETEKSIEKAEQQTTHHARDKI